MKNVSFLVTLVFCFNLSISSLGQCWKVISPGMTHTVAIKSDNTLWAWGFNGSGQLGDNTLVDKQVPVNISLTSDWLAVSAGGNHTLAIKTDGSLWAWGNNQWGQVGDGTFGNIRQTPVAISAEKDWIAISAGESFSIALKSDGTLWAWGDNFYGQLGHSTPAYAPKKVGIATNWKHISAGGNHVVALKTDNTLWAWGLNSSGQLGDGTQTNHSAPVNIGTTTSWQTVEAGYEHTLAIKSDGTLWTWGNNLSGELGIGTLLESSIPTQVGTSLWKSIKAGKDNSLALQNDGSLWAWGYIIGGVVMGEDTYRTTPTLLISTPIESIALGDDHAIAFASNGEVLTWGDGTWGKLGTDSWQGNNQPIVLFTPAPEGPAVQLICSGGGTIANLNAAGTNVLWYDTPNEGAQLPITTTLVDGARYYASQTKYGCVSQTRLEVLVKIRMTPAAPSGQTSYSFCNGEKLSAITITGSNIKWYESGTGGTELTPEGVTLTDNVHYFASQTIDGCESSQRFDVVANRNTSAAPTATSTTQTFCEGTTIANITTNSGTNIKWYSDATSVIQLSSTTQVVSGASYFATSTVGGLESCNRLKITTMITNASTPTGSTRQAFCNSGRVALLEATGTGTILWYNVPTGGTVLSGSQALVNGLYYASQKIAACESVERLPVEVVVNKTATPAPTGNANQILCDQAPVTDLVVNGQNIKWYLDPTGNTTWNAEALETSYYATQTIDACESMTRLKVTVTTNRTPLPIFPTAKPFRARLVVGSYDYSIAIMDDGTLWSWGQNNDGVLGNGTTIGRRTPQMINNDSDWVSVSAGSRHVLALKSDGTLWAWGSNNAGQLGDGSTTSRLVPTQIGTDTDWKMIAAGGSHSLALKANGTLWSSGSNYRGQTGILTDRGFPLIGLQKVGIETEWKAIAAGGEQSVAIKNDGTLWVWGKIGNGTNDGSTVQVKISSINPWRSVTSGSQHVLGIQTDGSLWAFGSNEYSQLGDGSDLYSQSEPSRVGYDTDWQEAYGGRAHSVALKSDGTLWAWGQNWYSQVGVPIPPNLLKSPTKVGNDSDWKSVTSGYEHNLAIRKDGTVWSWGRNRSGQLGDGTRLTGLSPQPIQTDSLFACGNVMLSDILSNASQLNWYSTATNTLLDPSTLINSGNQYFVSQSVNGKESCYRKEVTVVTNQTIPPAPTGNASQELCAGSKISDLIVTGTNIRWYDSQIGGTLLTSSTVLANGASYYAAQQPEGCESVDRLEVTVNLSVIEAPTVPVTQIFCEGAIVAQLSATGTSIKWYLTDSDPNSLDGKTLLINNTQYFAEQKIGSCKSSRVVSTITVNPIPPTPSGNASLIFCQPSTVADLQASGTNLTWYEFPTGGIPLVPSTALVNNKHYFATQTVNNCVSPQRLDVLAIITILNTPSANLNQNFCDGATVVNLVPSGTSARWYDAVTGGTALAPNTLLVSKKYFLAQTSGPCESPRLGVTVKIGPVPTAPTGNSSLTFCKSGIVANLSATGTNIKWFDVPTGGTALANTTSLVNGKHYYASQQPAGAYCASPRLDVAITINTPARPDVVATQEFCKSATIADLIATGTNLKWHSASTGGSILNPSTPLIDNQQYYVSQTISSCESDRGVVTAKIKPLPFPPIGANSQVFCNSATILSLIVSGENIQWFNANGTPIPITTELVNNGKYFAEQTVDGCTSADRIAVDVTIISPEIPQAESLQVFCEGASIANFNVTGTNLIWYSTSDATVSLPNTTNLEDGKLYFVAEHIDGCESSRQSIEAKINIIPDAPAGESIQILEANKTIADLVVVGENITWYSSEDDAIKRNNPLSLAQILTNNTLYYATQNLSGCESEEILEIRVSIITGIEQADYRLSYQPNPVKDYLNISMDKIINSVTLQNALGQIVLRDELDSMNGTIDLLEIGSGVYILSIFSGDHILAVKIVKQ